MAGAINFSGISSGIDTNTIISELASIERRPEALLKASQKILQQRQAAYATVSARLLNLQSSANTLDFLRAFQIVTGASSDATVATVTAQPGAQVGNHTLTVSTLAKSQVIGSGPQSSQTTPLNFSGQIVINGKAINVQAADSLQTLAGNINAAQTGVTASIISPSAGQYYLTLGSTSSGVQGKISLSDVGASTFLKQLGFIGNSGAISHQLAGSVGSNLFTDSATSVATLLGQTTPSVGSVQITTGSGTTNVSIDLNHSLSQIVTDINSALGTSAASVTTVTDPISGTNKQQLQIAGATGFTDSNNVLANLGFYQKSLAAGSELTLAQDASFTLDGLPATRASNTFADAISGVTITLLKDPTGNAGVKPSATVNVGADTATITSNINAFVTAFNSTIDTINNAATYDSTTNTTGILFGDSTTTSIVDALTSRTTGAIPGLPANLSALSQIGITLDTTNHLNVDSTALATALSTNLSGVAKLFQSSGTPTDSRVQYVTASANTQPSSTSGYAVNITSPATQATAVAGTAQTSPLLTDEVLTFAGPLFGTSNTATPLVGQTITLHAGSTAAAVVSQINGNPVIGATLSASLDGSGHLQFTSKSYGQNASFSVVSTVGAASNSSGIGRTVQTVTGTDVHGTINGEAATGNGQFLTGSLQGVNGVGNGQALGLELRITATTPGSYGTVSYSSGVADLAKNYINTQVDPYTGSLTTATSDLQAQYTDLQSTIASIEARVKADTLVWQQQFTNMETLVSNLKAASAGLASLGGGTAVSSPSSSSSSSSPGTIG